MDATADRVTVGNTRVLLIGLRQCLIMALGYLEDYLGMERTITPKHRRHDAEADAAAGR